jgi:hypothetical protein
VDVALNAAKQQKSSIFCRMADHSYFEEQYRLTTDAAPLVNKAIADCFMASQIKISDSNWLQISTVDFSVI